MLQDFLLYNEPLALLPSSKLLITTLNAHSYNVARNDKLFAQALLGSDILLPDGISVVWAILFLRTERLAKIAGEDLFYYEMNRLQKISGSCFFLGSSEFTLALIKKRIAVEFPQVTIHTYSPPFKPEFSAEDNLAMLQAINMVQPDVLFVGLTAPKQEKWAYKYFPKLVVGHVCCIGAVFDFYAGTVKRAPHWIIKIHCEWLYRLIKEPRRMWKRYLIGNFKFVFAVLNEKIKVN